MGRTSLAPMRCQQILDAAVDCILEHGVEGTTIAKIAASGGVPASLVHHYLGSRSEIMEAAVLRATENVEKAVSGALRADVPGERFRHHLDVLFSQSFETPEVNQLVDELVAASYRSPSLKESVRGMYHHFLEETCDALRAGFPRVPDETVQRAAYGIVALAHSAATLESIGVEANGRRFAREIAENWIVDLGDLELELESDC